jgi:membrane-associated phospholipid phosphatase
MKRNNSICTLFVLISLPVCTLAQDVNENTSRSFSSALTQDFNTYARNTAKDMLADQFQIWTFPKNLKKKKVLLPTLAVVGITSGLVAGADRPSANFFRHTQTFQGFNQTLSGNNTKLAMLALPAVYYGLGLVKQDSYARETAVLAGEAAIDAQLVTLATKRITGRLSPAAANGNFSDTWFKTSNGDFPSSHTATAFALATVFSHRYGNHKWVPYVAYSTAALVGISTVTQQGHSPSDVFMGAALGYTISRFAVLHRHMGPHMFVNH